MLTDALAPAQTDQLSSNTQPLDCAKLRQLVLDVINDRQDYEVLLDYLEPVTLAPCGLDAESTLTLALLLSEVENQARLNDRLYQLTQNSPAPTLVLSEAGIILALNSAAERAFTVKLGDSHEQLGITETLFLDFQQRLLTTDGPTLLHTLPTNASSVTNVMVASYHQENQIYLLQALTSRWPESIDRALQAVFGLSTSERKILSCLAEGMTSEQISEQRKRSLTTVRQQIKAVMSKLGAHRQNQVVALAASLASRTQQLLPTRNQSDHLSRHPLQLGEFKRGHRRIGWRRFGHTRGKPVLLLHGPFFGAGEFEQDRALAQASRLNVFVIERPGYGRTHPPAQNSDLLQTQVDDCLALLNHLELPAVTLLSHETGIIPALALATQQPERFLKLLAVSPSTPFPTDTRLDGIPRSQRMMLWSARNAIWITRLLIRLGMAQKRKLGPEHWVQAVFASDSQDLKVLQLASSRQGVLGAYSFNYTQHGLGLELDMQLLMSNWQPLIEQIGTPCNLITGQLNLTTPPDTIATYYTATNPAINLDILPEAGQTLCVSHAEIVFRKTLQFLQ